MRIRGNLLGKIRANGADYLSDIMQVGKDEKERRKEENERHAIKQGPRGKSSERFRARFRDVVAATLQ